MTNSVFSYFTQKVVRKTFELNIIPASKIQFPFHYNRLATQRRKHPSEN